MIRNATPGDMFTAPGEFALVIGKTSTIIVLVLSQSGDASEEIMEFQMSELDRDQGIETSDFAPITHIPWVRQR